MTSGERGLDRVVFDRVEVAVKDFRQFGYLFEPDVGPEQRVAGSGGAPRPVDPGTTNGPDHNVAV